MAIVSLIALLFALGIAALVSLAPREEDSVVPGLIVAPELEIALGDAVAVSPERELPISSGRAASIAETRLVAEGVPVGERTPRGLPGVAPARVVAKPVSGGPTGSSPPAQPESPLAPQPAATPIATPISAPSPPPVPTVATPTRPGYGGQPTRPGSAGGPGPEGGTIAGPVKVYDGDEYAYSFSFYVQPDAYRVPGEDNLILRFADEADESHSLGLQLWDDGGGTQRGLWASGEAMGGERFLGAVAEGVWHELVLTFEASNEDDGLYLLLLDGEPIDARAWVSLIDPGSDHGLLEAGLFRDGERVAGAPEIFFGPARLGETVEAVIP